MYCLLCLGVKNTIMTLKIILMIIVICCLPYSARADTAQGEIGAVIINLDILSKKELRRFCFIESHVKQCKELKKKWKKNAKLKRERNQKLFGQHSIYQRKSSSKSIALRQKLNPVPKRFPKHVYVSRDISRDGF